jgi:ATP-dependent Zn protease
MDLRSVCTLLENNVASSAFLILSNHVKVLNNKVFANKSTTNEGYVIYAESDILDRTGRGYLDRIAMTLAGYAAENIVLGDATDGISSDFETATKIARAMAINFGMSPDGNLVVGPILGSDQRDTAVVEKRMQNILDAGYKRAQDLLVQHAELWREMTVVLSKKGVIERPELLDLVRKHWHNTEELGAIVTGKGREALGCPAMDYFLSGKPIALPKSASLFSRIMH